MSQWGVSLFTFKMDWQCLFSIKKAIIFYKNVAIQVNLFFAKLHGIWNTHVNIHPLEQRHMSYQQNNSPSKLRFVALPANLPATC